MVLGVLAVRAARKPADGKIEPRGAKLPLVVAIGLEVGNARCCRSAPQDVGRSPVRGAVATPAALESQRPRIAEEPDGQSGGDAADAVLVARKPGEGADRSRPEHEAPCQAGTLLQELACKHGRRAYARQVVVGQRWVAGVGVDDGFLGRRARYDALGIRQAAGASVESITTWNGPGPRLARSRCRRQKPQCSR